MKRQIVKLSNGISKIIMVRGIVLEVNRKCRIISLSFLASNISLNNLFHSMKLYRHAVEVYLEGTVSQFLYGS